MANVTDPGIRGAETGAGGDGSLREGVPQGYNEAEPVLRIGDLAKEKVLAVMSSQDPPVRTLRISVPYRGKYAMNLEPEGKPGIDDTVLPYAGFEVYVDPHSLTFLQGASLDFVEAPGGGGFKFENPNDAPQRPAAKQAPEGPEGDFWRQVQEVLDEEVNPAVASHGGFINLMDIQGNTLYIQMGGGCQGCGMAAMTLKQGVERILKDRFPQIEEILDTTDHAGGRNPYYAGA
jgi:Fe/S biogenesis protein NfuA